MASSIDSHLAQIHDIRERLLHLVDGMDYCMDWKPEPSAWSARQIVYHLLDTPPGGLASVVKGVISGSLTEYDLWSDLDNITPERQEHDFQEVLQDVTRFFSSIEETLAEAGSQDLAEKRALVHNKSRGTDNQRTAGEILEGGFSRHWAAHLEQLQELRESLGF